MDRHVLWNTLLLQLLFSVCVCLHTRAPPLPSQISPPSGNAWEMPMSMSKCSLRVEPPELVVRFGDPVSVNCSYSQKTYLGWEGLPVAIEPVAVSFLPWTEKSLSHWSIKPQCFAVRDVDHCVVNLTVTVYQPPERVSLNFRNHTGALLEDPSGQLVEGHQYSLQCEVWAVAPAQNITVTFYRGHRELKVQTSRTSDKTPVNESFSLNYTVSREDHGAHFWCEVKLELGPAGPQLPPVVRSQNITAEVHYAPFPDASAEPLLLTVAYGESAELNCSSEGNPSPHYSWSVPSEPHTLFSDSVFIIHSASSQHEGLYSCNASNSIGSVGRSFTVKVHVNYVPIIVAMVLVGLLLAGIVASFVYLRYYRVKRTGEYNPIRMFRSHCHTAAPVSE